MPGLLSRAELDEVYSGALLLFKLLSAGADRRRAAAWSPHRGRAAAENRQDKDRADSGQ